MIAGAPETLIAPSGSRCRGSGVRRHLRKLTVLGTALAACGCGDPPSSETPTLSPPAVATAAEPEPAATPTAVVETTAAGDSSPEKMGTEFPPPASEPVRETHAPPAEAPRIPPELREPVAALRKLGARIEFGAGDRLIGVDLTDRPVTDADLVHLRPLSELRSLNLSGTNITDAGLKELGENAKLKFLYLFNTPITDAGLQALEPLSRLEVLCLDQTEITDAGLETLKAFTRLEKLHVHSRQTITDAGLEALAVHRRLFELRIGGPGVTEAGRNRLQTALPNCTIAFDAASEAPTD
uniref:Leucine-rich repeat domain-containing protein n=1 Tax=Schlesneria paludicola TaxID=360056 RepID=A0A7C2NVM9_9PLAN